MPSEAVFVRTDTPNGVQFDVTPASKPAGTSAFLTVGGGCLGLFNGMFLGVFAAIPTYIISSLILGSGFGSLPAMAVMCGIVVWFTLKTARRYRAFNPKSRQTRLVVSSAGIQHPGGFVKADDIAELILRHPHERGGYTVSTYSDSAAYNTGRQLGAELRNRSFALMARCKSISTPEVIVHGLTWNVGEALLNDIREAMGEVMA